MPPEASEQTAKSGTLIIICPICQSDDGDTLGVTGAMDGSLASTVVMQCGSCQSVYLSPPPDRQARDGAHDETRTRVFDRAIGRLKKNIPTDTTFVSADTSGIALLERDPDAGRFGLILLPLTLESAGAPGELLSHAAKLLDENGRIELVVGNVGSSCFRYYRGRHWCGYRYPRTRQQLSAKGIALLAERAGLRVSEQRSSAAPAAWLISTRNWLEDWGAKRIVVGLLTGPWLVPWLVAALFEGIATLRRRGAVLSLRLEKE